MRAALSALAIALGAGLLIAAATGRGDDVSLPAVSEVRAQGSLDADGARFGDPVIGRLDVLLPRDAVDPGSVRLRADFAPFRLVRPPSVERLVSGPAALVRYRFELECLTTACLPSRDGRGFVLPSAAVSFADAGGAPRTLAVAWPAVGTASWHGGAGVDPQWRSGLERLPAYDYLLPPRTTVLLFALVAAALTVAAIAILFPSIRRALPKARPATDRRSLLERALATVRSAAGRDDPAERRRALDLLSRELRTRRRVSEAGDASHLAWSRAEPEGGEMEEIADRVERAGA